MNMKLARKLHSGDQITRKSDRAVLTVVRVIDSRGLTMNRVSVEARTQDDLLVTLKHTEIE